MEQLSRPTSRVQLGFAFAAIVVLLGVNFVAVRFSNRELDPMWGAALRFFLASAILFALMAARRIPLFQGRVLWGAVWYGVLSFGLVYALLYWALLRVSSGMTSVLFATLPLATLLLAAFFRIERLGWLNTVGALVALGGIAFVFQNQVSLAVPAIGLVAVLAAVVVAAGASVLIKRLPPVHPIALNAVGMGVGAAMLLAGAVAFRERIAIPVTGEAIAAVAWLIFSSIVAFILFVWLIRQWTASAVSYALVLAPLVTIIISHLLERARFTSTFFIGSGLVLFGAYLGTKKAKQKSRNNY